MSRRWIVFPAVAAIALVPLAVSLPAQASPSPAATTDYQPLDVSHVTPLLSAGEESVTLALKPGDARAFSTILTRTSGLSLTSRATLLQAVEPRQSTVSLIASTLGAEGLTVTPYTAWAEKVTGPAALLDSVFRVTEVADGSYHHPSAAPTVPAAIASSVSTVLGFDTRPKYHHQDIGPVPLPTTPELMGYNGTDFRKAYNVPATGLGQGTTVATLQLDTWNPSDLQLYANLPDISLASYYTSSTYTPVAVDGQTDSPASLDPTDSGHTEVALDQESVFSNAPEAKQRAYFAANTDMGFLDVFLDMAADAAKYKITSASSSWGECEQDTDALSPGATTADNNAVTAMVASGVTFFSAAGDNGAYDCAGDGSSSSVSTSTLSVDEPGSFPATISVGGTTLPTATFPPAETVWDGGGGGASIEFKRPAYQSRLTQTGTARLVPDLTSDADPDTGAEVVDTGLGSTVVEGVGGTSLASPTQAAELAAALSSEGCSAGLGDIHQDLYDHEADFNDITSGSNNNGSTKTPGYAAVAGYDEASGLGSPNWTKLVADITAETPCSTSPELGAAASLPDASAPAALLGVGLLAAMGTALSLRRRRDAAQR